MSNSPINGVHTLVVPPRTVRISQCNTLTVQNTFTTYKKVTNALQVHVFTGGKFFDNV